MSSTKTGATTDIASTDNPSYLHWITNDAHVRMLLSSTISEASYQHVQGTTSRDLWLSLERAYAPNNSSREYTLKTQLLKIEMKGDETSSAYLTRAQEYATALSNIGEPVKDKYLTMQATFGILDEYSGLKSNFLARSPPITFPELYGLLSDHEFMIKRSLPAVPHAFTGVVPGIVSRIPAAPQAQMTTLQQLAAQLGYQISPIVATNNQPQAFYPNRTSNNYQGKRCGNSR